MRRIIKKEDSEIISKKLNYKIGGDNSKIRDILLTEQNHICAYTELHLGVGFKKEIEHFNPNLKKNSTKDNYQNWFLVSGEWNGRKSYKWLEPILHPTAEDFEQRIIYLEGRYICAKEHDEEAQNLITLLMLDNENLDKKRINYISHLREAIKNTGGTAQDFLDKLFKVYPDGIYFIRAIEEEFQVKIKFN